MIFYCEPQKPDIIHYSLFTVSFRSLQKIQNDILRISYKIKLSDQISTKELNNKSKLLSLEQRMHAKTVVTVNVCRLSRCK